ncbi:MAG: two-component system sensor histidine kinase NtrB [Rhizomicrobium sp.]
MPSLDDPEFSIANALPQPILVVGAGHDIVYANPSAEQFFTTGAAVLRKHSLADLLPFGSPLLNLLDQVRAREATAVERDLDLSAPRHGERVADVIVSPLSGGALVIAFFERSLAHRMDRQWLARDAVRSMHGMAQVLAHEIKNPLAGIRGAAQLLEEYLPPGEREMTRLICEESDRIRALIDRMEAFGDSSVLERRPVNIHEVLDRVRRVAESGFSRGCRFVENFDPSLPPVAGDRDRLIQVFLNLVRNAVDALPETGGEIALATSYRPGVRFGAGSSGERASLPLEVLVRDNGRGVPIGLLPHIFDPFVTTKPRGSGLGLALVAKIVGDHGGVIECDSAPGRTTFRVLLPIASAREA